MCTYVVFNIEIIVDVYHTHIFCLYCLNFTIKFDQILPLNSIKFLPIKFDQIFTIKFDQIDSNNATEFGVNCEYCGKILSLT